MLAKHRQNVGMAKIIIGRFFVLRLFETGGKQELRSQKSDGRSQIICSLFSVFDTY